MDFRYDTIAYHFVNDSPNAVMFIGTANICDKEGNFLFYTNGIYVRDRYGNLMENGDSLCYDVGWYSAFNNVYQTIYQNGLPSDQSVIVLPKPGSNHLYYIFHYLTTDTSYIKAGMINRAPLVLYYSVVDMNANFGLGAVIMKNIRLPIYQMMCSSRMTACKHANGRDWWIIRHGDRDSTYIKFLFAPDTILGPYFQKIGPAFNRDGGAQDFRGTSVFNQDGTQMATANFWGPVVVLDFDRCSGEFSNPKVINNMLEDTTWYGASNLALSPSGRYLYAHNIYGLNQYDLWSANLNDSVRLYTRDSTDPYWLGAMQLAPNGKIYVSKWNGGSYSLHVIHQPDELGLACSFEFDGQACITANTVNLPNMPNYKLGALAGSACDTITDLTHPQPLEGGLESQLKVFPNPATEYVVVDYGFTDWSKGGVSLEISNEQGQLVHTQTLPMYSGFQKIDVSHSAAGIYNATVMRNGAVVSRGRFTKQ